MSRCEPAAACHCRARGGVAGEQLPGELGTASAQSHTAWLDRFTEIMVERASMALSRQRVAVSTPTGERAGDAGIYKQAGREA